MGCAPSKSRSPPHSPPPFADVAFIKADEPQDPLEAERVAAAAAKQALAAKLAAKQATAATLLQAAVRGKAGRDRFELMKHPCNNYRVNMAAATFATCFCGWAKAAHSEEALACGRRSTKKDLASFVSPTALRERFIQRELATCKVYRVNMNSINFGECLCGVAKVGHTPAALAAGDSAKPNAAVDEVELRKKFVQRAKVTCTRYRVNVTAENTGECVCGAARNEHTDAALAAGEKGGNAAVDEVELRKKFAQRAKVECTMYVVDMNAQIFATCVCGAPRSEHSDAALGSKVKSQALVDSEEVRSRLVQKTAVVACEKFEIDMAPGVPFGTCVCGEPKVRHSEKALQRRSSAI